MAEASVERLERLLVPAVEALGCRLWGIELEPLGRRKLLRVYIDKEEGVSIDDCEKVSHQVSGILDVEEVIAGSFTLEVSSPGLDRVLFKEAQFVESIDEELDVRLRMPREGRRHFRGRLLAVADGQISLIVEGSDQPLGIQMEDIAKARIVPKFD